MVTLAALLSVGVLTPTALAEGDEAPADTPPTTSEVVAVGQPPVPPTTTTPEVVAVGQPPVPPTTTTPEVVAVGQPPVPPTTSSPPRVAAAPAAIANRPAADVDPPETRVSDAAQAIAVRLELLLSLLP